MRNLITGQIKILIMLAKYKYLPPSLMVLVGVRSSAKNVNKILHDLYNGRKPLIKKFTFAPDPRRGRLENFYCLTKEGALFLVNNLAYELETIRYPIGNTGQFFNDYWHRKYCILFQIHLEKWAESKEWSVIQYDTYFDKVGAKETGILQTKTKLFLNNGTTLIPDGIGVIEKDGDASIFCVEMHCGNESKRFLDHATKLIQSISEGTVSNKYQVKKNIFVVNVFETEKFMNNCLDRLEKSDLPDVGKFFLFKSIDKLIKDFGNWKIADGNTTSFPPSHN